MDKRENFSTRFFEPETTDETHQTEDHKEERPIHETPEEIKVEAEEVDSYPEKCLRDNVWFTKCHTHPNSSSEESYVGDIESKTSHIRIVEHFCDIDTESINPSSKQNKEKAKLSICCVNGSKNLCLPLEQETDREQIQTHTEWPENKCFFFWFDTPHAISESKFQVEPDNIEKSVDNRKSTKWDDVGKRYWEKKPGEKEPF